MLENKFRGQTENGNWIYGGVAYYHSIASNRTYIVDEHLNLIPVKPETVCQFTGFKDIGGKEIYEGDIIQNDTHTVVFVYRIEWHTDCWVGVRNDEADLLGNLIDAMSFKVIGNIHDNPELLEGGVNVD